MLYILKTTFREIVDTEAQNIASVLWWYIV